MPLPDVIAKTYENITVYVIDDDVPYMEVFRVAAGQFAHLNLRTFVRVQDFDAALSDTPATRHVIFFLDIRLGPVLGFELCRRIRSGQMFSFAPVIFMSSSLLQADINEARRAGGNSYFHKPTGTRARVDMVRRQLLYWMDDVNLPTADSHSTAAEEKSMKVGYTPKPNSRSRGTPLYALDRLRQDILVALLQDLNMMNGQKISESTSDKLERSLSRLQEIFVFMAGLFGSDVISSITAFCESILAWLHLGSRVPALEDLVAQQRIHLNCAKTAKEDFSRALHKARLDGVSDDAFLRLDSWIWDVFNELGDGPTFPKLYISLKRFQTRVF